MSHNKPISTGESGTASSDQITAYLSISPADYPRVIWRMIRLFVKASGVLGVLEIIWRVLSPQTDFLISYLTGRLIDQITLVAGSGVFGPHVVSLALLYVGVRGVVAILDTWAVLLYRLNRRKTEGLYDALIINRRSHLPVFLFEHPLISRIGERINKRADVSVFLSTLRSLWGMLINIVGVIVTALILLRQAPVVGVIFALSGGIQVIPSIYRNKISVLVYEASLVLRRMTGWGWWEVVSNHIRSLRLKVVGLYEYMATRVVPWVFLSWDIYLAQAKWFFKWDMLVSLFSLGLEFLSLYILFFQVINGKSSVGKALFLISTYGRGVSDLSSLLMTFANWQTDIPYIKLYFDFVSGKIESELKRELKAPSVRTDASAPVVYGNDIVITDLYFKYPTGKRWVLKGINMNIPAGGKIAIVGENGAGKTTLLKILMGFYPLYKGKVYLGDKDMLDTDWTQLVYKISYLPQDVPQYEYFTPYEVIKIDELKRQGGLDISQLMAMRVNIDVNDLYHKIRKGIIDDLYRSVYLKHQLKARDLKAVIRAAKRAKAHEFIKSLPKGYFTPLSSTIPEGVALSLGQWQRLHLARVFYSPLDMLILDEPTSAIDPHAGFEIIERLFKVFEDKTIIIVSHRYSMIMGADYVYVLKQGQIIEEGTPQELIKNRGYFYEAYRKELEKLNQS